MKLTDVIRRPLVTEKTTGRRITVVTTRLQNRAARSSPRSTAPRRQAKELTR